MDASWIVDPPQLFDIRIEQFSCLFDLLIGLVEVAKFIEDLELSSFKFFSGVVLAAPI